MVKKRTKTRELIVTEKGCEPSSPKSARSWFSRPQDRSDHEMSSSSTAASVECRTLEVCSVA